MMRAVYEGDLRCSLTHERSGAVLHTDAPVDNHGRGEAFSPTDLVAASLLSCALTVIGIEANAQGWDVTGMEGQVEKHMIADPHRRIARLVCEVRLPARLEMSARAALAAVAEGCPTCRSLAADTRVELQVI